MITSSSLATMRWTSSDGVADVVVALIPLPNHHPRFPGALQRSSRCSAEPASYQTPHFVRPRLCSAPLRKGYALRCVRGTERISFMPCPHWLRWFVLHKRGPRHALRHSLLP